MNKLQKLFEKNIPVSIGDMDSPGEIDAKIWVYERCIAEFFDDFNQAVNWLWEEAKKHYPDAECFKEEK